MNSKTEKILFYLFLVIASVIVVWKAISLNANFDTGDGIQHYLISHFSWKHPELLLDLWGKPFFTLISSPFSQFGLKGMIIFQGICAVFTTFFVYKIAIKLNFKYAWTAPAFIFFSPIYFAVINTGLTEIFFGCIFIFSVWLIYEKKFILAAIAASFIPFVRPEGYIVLPLIASVLFFRKKFLAIPLLFSATLIYTIIGYFYFGDILWIITNNYKIDENYIGMKGSFLHFVNHYDEIWGKVYTILLVIGICRLLFSFIQLLQKKIVNDFLFEEIFLILGSFLGCLLLHSLLYWMPGVLNNLGMIRYMTTLIPSAALLSLRGINLITVTPLRKFFYLETLTICIILFFIVRGPIKQWYYSFYINNEQAVINVTGNWLNSFPKNHKVCYMNPCLPIITKIDPFNEKTTTLLWSLNTDDINSLPDSTIIIWDSHYAPQEGNLPLSLLLENKLFIPLKHFKYYNENLPFETWAFMKTNSQHDVNPFLPLEIVTDLGILSDFKNNNSNLFDFEPTSSLDNEMISKEKSFLGNNSLRYTSKNEFGPVFTRNINNFKNSNELRMIKVQFQFFSHESIKDLFPTIEITNNDKKIERHYLNLNQSIKLNEWNFVQLELALHPNEVSNLYDINFYFWNKGKNSFYIDDLNLHYY